METEKKRDTEKLSHTLMVGLEIWGAPLLLQVGIMNQSYGYYLGASYK